METMDAVVDEPIDSSAEEIDDGAAEEVEGGAETAGGAEGRSDEKNESDSPYTTKFSREMRAALKQWEQANPEAAKFAKQARDNHARLFALSQLEPKGIDGVRERYALLDSLTHGELKGHEALTAIQEELGSIEEVDEMLASGDPKAFDALGDDFNEGLAKLAPVYLDRVMRSDPAAFEAAVMPYFVSMLAQSPILNTFNRAVDETEWRLSRYLVQDDEGKLRLNHSLPPEVAKEFSESMLNVLSKIGKEFNGLQQKVGSSIAAKPGNTDQRTQFEQERSQLEEERQTLHWDTKIKPVAAAHENKTFDTLFEPYQKRLKLDTGAKADLMQAFKAGLGRAGSSDATYMAQLKIYRKQRNPDPSAVANFVKNSINKHAKPVLESLIKARYGSFLAGKSKAATQSVKSSAKTTPAGQNVEVRSVKPRMEEIDHRNTPLEWSTPKKDGSRQYRLYNGKVVVYRPPAA